MTFSAAICPLAGVMSGPVNRSNLRVESVGVDTYKIYYDSFCDWAVGIYR